MNLNEQLKKHRITLTKKYGQNFISDPALLERIADVCDWQDGDVALEIGPGAGTLTRAIASHADRMLAIEIDKRLAPLLKESLSNCDNVKLVFGDALKLDLDALVREELGHDGDYKLVANLPYYITTPIIMGILENGTEAESITIMMQKEVADRIKAAPGGKTYGALSVAVQYYCTVEQVAIVPKEVFIPRPKVDSSVLHLSIRSERPVELTDEKTFFACIKHGFGQRRKTLLNSLTGVNGLSKDEVRAVLQEAGIDPVRRAETLDIKEFAVIANIVAAHCGR